MLKINLYSNIKTKWERIKTKWERIKTTLRTLNPYSNGKVADVLFVIIVSCEFIF